MLQGSLKAAWQGAVVEWWSGRPQLRLGYRPHGVWFTGSKPWHPVKRQSLKILQRSWQFRNASFLVAFRTCAYEQFCTCIRPEQWHCSPNTPLESIRFGSCAWPAKSFASWPLVILTYLTSGSQLELLDFAVACFVHFLSRQGARTYFCLAGMSEVLAVQCQSLDHSNSCLSIDLCVTVDNWRLICTACFHMHGIISPPRKGAICRVGCDSAIASIVGWISSRRRSPPGFQPSLRVARWAVGSLAAWVPLWISMPSQWGHWRIKMVMNTWSSSSPLSLLSSLSSLSSYSSSCLSSS